MQSSIPLQILHLHASSCKVGSIEVWGKRTGIQEMPSWKRKTFKEALHQLGERLWESPGLSHFCVRIQITGASSQRAVSDGKEPEQCQAAVHHNLAEAPCSVTYFFKLFFEQLQRGSRLIFVRPGRRQCHCPPPLEPVRLPCCVLWSWTRSFECTLNTQRWSGSLTCLLPLCLPRLSYCTGKMVLVCLASLR